MLDKIKTIVTQYVEIDPDQITGDTSLKGDLGLTSLAMMNMLVEIEDEFGVEIDEGAAAQFETLQDVMAYLSDH